MTIRTMSIYRDLSKRAKDEQDHLMLAISDVIEAAEATNDEAISALASLLAWSYAQHGDDLEDQLDAADGVHDEIKRVLTRNHYERH